MPKTPTLPTVAEQGSLLEAAATSTAPEPAKAEPTKSKATKPGPPTAAPIETERELASIALEVPTLARPRGYIRRRLDVTLDRRQAEQLRALELALQSTSSRLKNGKHVTTNGDAIRWLLEQMAARQG